MKPTRTILALFIVVLALPMAAAGQDEEALIVVASNNGTIDDSVVVSRKSLADLRRDVYRAEEDFYSLYNTLNDDKEYDVRCFYEVATGTHIKNHVCRAKFVTKSFAANAARNRNDMSRVANKGSNPELVEKTAKYQEKMETLVAANPELLAAFARYNTARVEFFAEREEMASN